MMDTFKLRNLWNNQARRPPSGLFCVSASFGSLPAFSRSEFDCCRLLDSEAKPVSDFELCDGATGRSMGVLTFHER